jgi:hypothetical protein
VAKNENNPFLNSFSIFTQTGPSSSSSNTAFINRYFLLNPRSSGPEAEAMTTLPRRHGKGISKLIQTQKSGRI